MIPACMTHESLVNEDWTRVVSRLGGAAQLEVSARETKAFVRRREIPDAVALLRLMLAYCLGERGLLQSRSRPMRPLRRAVKHGETHNAKAALSPKKLSKPQIGSSG